MDPSVLDRTVACVVFVLTIRLISPSNGHFSNNLFEAHLGLTQDVSEGQFKIIGLNKVCDFKYQFSNQIPYCLYD